MLKIQTSQEIDSLCAQSSLAVAPAVGGGLVVGIGPFRELESPPVSGTAFYRNNFRLSEPRPWLVPSEVRSLRLHEPGPTAVEIGPWEDPDTEIFATVFREVSESIAQGVIEKSVPACAARAGVLSGGPRQLLKALADVPAPLMPYGFWQGEQGFVGASPELLFSLEAGRLETMALAGTARSEEAEIFAFDDKEIREHEFVAQTLVSKLSDIGMVTRKGREVMNLGALIHFLSRIEVELYREEKLDDLIRRLHPTPALGPLPRTRQTLGQLYQWRRRLRCPEFFGAPFGVLHEGRFASLVAIRCVHWRAEELFIPSGCGLIEASRLVNEWRELRLKRESVRQLFGL